MRNPIKLENELDKEALHLSEKYDGAPVLIVLAGSESAKIPRCITGFSHVDRLRVHLGILQAAIQIETLRHFGRLGPRRFTKIQI